MRGLIKQEMTALGPGSEPYQDYKVLWVIFKSAIHELHFMSYVIHCSRSLHEVL